ncbi:hypothetical protein PHYC_02591 [Phycisphaerales bacterium]|nr:hypothetical protein PHYC_02591 [Phycisphaerales bacterium]
MITINLLPAHRVRALRLRRRTRAWCLFGVAYILAIIALWSTYAAGSGVSTGMAEQISTAKTLLDSNERELEGLQKVLAEARNRVESAKAIVDHPDWSTLLEVLARTRGEDVALERLALAQRPDSVARPGDLPARGPWTLNVAGAAASHGAATQFVLRLERSGLFESVSLSETRERGGSGIAGTTALIDFTVVCTVPNRAPALPPPEGRP